MKHNFKELIIWQKGMDLARKSYELSRSFPDSEKYGLTSQIRRCSVSIPSNIAEGCGRGTDSQLVYFIDVSLGSSCELETQMILAFDFQYVTKNKFEEMIEIIGEFQRRTRSFRDKIQHNLK